MTERVQTEVIRELTARLKQAVEYLEHPDVTPITAQFIVPSWQCAAHCREAIAHAEGKPVSGRFEKFE